MNKIMDFLQINIGFSWKGLAVFILPMLPNVLFFILKNPNGRTAVTNNHLFLNIVEHGSQGIFAALLIFVVSRKESPLLNRFTILALIFLLAYCGLWAAYFTTGADFTMLMLMAVVPVIYFVLAEIWLHNLPAVIFTAIFGIAHTIITYIDYHNR